MDRNREAVAGITCPGMLAPLSRNIHGYTRPRATYPYLMWGAAALPAAGSDLRRPKLCYARGMQEPIPVVEVDRFRCLLGAMRPGGTNHLARGIAQGELAVRTFFRSTSSWNNGVWDSQRVTQSLLSGTPVSLHPSLFAIMKCSCWSAACVFPRLTREIS